MFQELKKVQLPFLEKKKKKALSGKLKRNGVELKTNSVVFDKAFYVLQPSAHIKNNQ